MTDTILTPPPAPEPITPAELDAFSDQLMDITERIAATNTPADTPPWSAGYMAARKAMLLESLVAVREDLRSYAHDLSGMP